MKKLSALILALVALTGMAAIAVAAPAPTQTFSAHLSGRNETPPVDTSGQGQFSARLSKDGTKLFFRLNVANLKNITAAHLHMAPKGQDGDVVVTLYNGPTKTVRQRALLAKGTITAAELSGPLAGETLKDLVDAMKAGNVYVNVHTTENPDGAIRGQVRKNPAPQH